MDAHPPTTADFAAMGAARAQLNADDCIVLIGWLVERVNALEERLGFINVPGLPDLPSGMHGFGCIPARSKAVQEAFSKLGLRDA